MKHLTLTGKVLGLGLLLLCGALFFNARPAYADVSSLQPLEITPLCSVSASNTTYWKVYNKNSVDVPVDWKSVDHGVTGSYDAPAGESQMSSYYDGTDPNNTTQFVWEGQTTQTNAPANQCDPSTVPTPTPTPTPPTCVDGTDPKNLVVTELTAGTVEIHTLNNQLLCDDVTIYFSDYLMPSTYDGNGFYNNPTAVPQTLYRSSHATMLKDTDGMITLSIDLPDGCNNFQTDVYYAPEITTVTASGHGSQYITGKIYPSTGPCTPTPPTGGSGGGSTPTPTPTPTPTQPSTGGHVLGSTTTTPAVASSSTAQLANTGVSPVLPSIFAIVLVGTALLIARRKTQVQG